MASNLQSKDSGWMKEFRKKFLFCFFLPETHFSIKDNQHLKVKGWTKKMPITRTRKQMGNIIPMPDKK